MIVIKTKHIRNFTIIMVIISIILTGNTIGHREIDREEYNSRINSSEVELSLEDIKKRGVLKAITMYSSTDYFLYKGKPMGYEYELLQRFAESMNINLEIVVAKNNEDAFEMLRRGDGDIIATGLTINAENKEKAAFSYAHKTTKQILIQRKPWNWTKLKLHEIEKKLIRNPFELSEKAVYVRANSAEEDRLNNLADETGQELNILQIPSYMSTYEIMEKVANESFDYAVVNENQAKINLSDFPNLDIETAMSLPIRTGWAMRQNADDLKRSVNTWILKMRKDVDYYVIYNKYFKNRRFFERRVKSPYYSKEGKEISPFDSLIQENSNSYDWRFIASLIYQESQFKKDTNSWVGAVGLMQLMPETAKSLGVTNPKDPVQNITAGVKYLDYLFSFWESVPDSVQRLKFALASYNGGVAHVLDAQRLAEKYDEDPNRWDENVELFIRKLSQQKYFTDPVVKYGYCRGEEPFKYVEEIFQRYDHYRRFIPSKKENQLMTSVSDYKPQKVF